jgi:hypothetical protein
VVVDFAIKDNPDCPNFVAYRLVTAGNINDAKPTHADADVAIGVKAFIIRAAMHHRGTHLPDYGRFDADVLPELHYPRDAAHIKSPKP